MSNPRAIQSADFFKSGTELVICVRGGLHRGCTDTGKLVLTAEPKYYWCYGGWNQ